MSCWVAALVLLSLIATASASEWIIAVGEESSSEGVYAIRKPLMVAT